MVNWLKRIKHENEPVTEVPKEAPVEISKPLEKMTKDELNDLAAKNGFEEEIKSSMKKKTIIEKLKGLLKLK